MDIFKKEKALSTKEKQQFSFLLNKGVTIKIIEASESLYFFHFIYKGKLLTYKYLDNLSPSQSEGMTSDIIYEFDIK